MTNEDYQLMQEVMSEYNELVESGFEFKPVVIKENENTSNMEKNEVIFEVSDYKFTDFSEEVFSKASNEEKQESWFIKLRELDSKIHSAGLEEKINFTDDRLVVSAYKIFLKTEMFNESPSKRDWWIARRYINSFASNKFPFQEELLKVVSMYIGFTFSKAEMTDEQKKEIAAYMKLLQGVVYEEGYLELPDFVLAVISGQEDIDGEDVLEEEKNDFSDEKSQWQGLLDVANLMIEDAIELSEAEIAEWKKAKQEAEFSLSILK